ncbi:GNAT family N-acetyltransferase [Jonesia quinghaiensis]|uniref:GNAT family N-acetyltransferase n=1 Tax=Jonesia quinghaiensis TaxID=262806 RepID=UPI0003FCFDA2|nr:GNAT family N-acetyltransferase [Jonesia quinghaiensis]
MPFPQNFTVTAMTPEDKRAVYEFALWAFPSTQSLEDFLRQTQPFPSERSVVVRDPNQEIAAFHTSYAFTQFNVPGATLPTSGLSWVGVHPQHRRKGLLRAIIERHFADCVERNEAISVLFAAEPGIYGRFGYGRAAYDVRCRIPRGATQRPLIEAPAGDGAELTVRIELFNPDQHIPIIEVLHARAGHSVNGTGLNRPGWATREADELRTRLHTVAPPPNTREATRIVLILRDGEPVGYTKFHRELNWENTGPNGHVATSEVVALDPAASWKLWSVITEFDLTGYTDSFMLPIDDPIVTRLENNRSITMHHVDNVWARIIDLKTALEGRQYACDVEVVLEVTDTLIESNAGRWKLIASAFDGPSGSRTPTVERTDETPDITLGIRDLGAVYLGGTSLSSLASAGLVHAVNPRALATASTAFGWPHAPMSSWVF